MKDRLRRGSLALKGRVTCLLDSRVFPDVGAGSFWGGGEAQTPVTKKP